MIWIYKCNAKNREHQWASGDWNEFFSSRNPQQWGSTRLIPKLVQAHAGDTIIAYQTDRNELVGTARVVRWKRKKGANDLILRPLETIGVRVRPLKAHDPRVAQIPALQPGPIQTLYPISKQDAKRLLRAAGSELVVDADVAQSEAHNAVRGAGFGSPEENKLVEKAAVKAVGKKLRTKGWSVRDVSNKKLGYDLVCDRKGKHLHVEVKGSRGTKQQFIITEAERKSWLGDPLFTLAFVGGALSESPMLVFFPDSTGAGEFVFRPLSYVAVRRPLIA